MNRNDIVTFIDDCDFDNPSKIFLADGFEQAFLGVGGKFNDEQVAIYDRDKCIEILADEFQKDDFEEISFEKEATDFYEQAVEYFDYNVQGSYVGESTPIFITLMEKIS